MPMKQDDAISVYHLDEVASGAVVDEQGNNNGTNYGATINQTGKFGKCYSFDGASYIDCGTASSLRLGSTGSISFWYKSTVSGYYLVVSNGNFDTGRDGYMIYVYPNSIGLLLCTGSAYQEIYYLHNGIGTDGIWHHVVATWDGSTINLYVDGVPVTPVTQTLTPTGYLGSLCIGKSSIAGEYYFVGSIDEVRIYNRALTADEVQNLYTLNTPEYFAWVMTELQSWVQYLRLIAHAMGQI